MRANTNVPGQIVAPLICVFSSQTSTLAVVVLKWSRSRRRYGRQGLLIEEHALERAEAECLNDAEARAIRREREAERRAALDIEFVTRFARRERRSETAPVRAGRR